MKRALVEILKAQDTLNQRINEKAGYGPDWRAQKHPYYRAAYIEATELMDHVGYKWWKAGSEMNSSIRAQAYLELADIFHFGLSEMLLVAESDDESAFENVSAYLLSALPQGADLVEGLVERKGVVREAIDDFVGTTATVRRFSWSGFRVLCQVFGLSLESLIRIYHAKHVLNGFRQDHGYKEGTYIKQWPLGDETVEDNVALMLCVDELETSLALSDWKAQLADKLQDRYQAFA